jgi:tRNA(Ile)-lysidine synthase
VLAGAPVAGDVPKAQLVATLKKAKSALPTIRPTATPILHAPRLRALMPALAAEGGDARNLARLASRLARANAAVEVLADGAERYLALRDRNDAARMTGLTRQAFAGLCCRGNPPSAAAARDRPGRSRGAGGTRQGRGAAGGAGPGRCGNGEGRRLKQTLAGALVSLIDGRIRVEPAPPRRAAGRT